MKLVLLLSSISGRRVFVFFCSLWKTISYYTTINIQNDINAFNSLSTFSDFSVTYTMLISFFSHGIFFPFFIYLTKLTKTETRVSFFGIITLIYLLNFSLAFVLSNVFETFDMFIMLASLIGFLNSFFVFNNQDEMLVKDLRKLENEDDCFSIFPNNNSNNNNNNSSMEIKDLKEKDE